METQNRKIAAIYCRVSTDSQEQEGTSLQSQLEACLNKTRELGYEVPEEFIILETYSGLTLDRPKLPQLRQWVRDKEVDAVTAYTLDRLSRDPVHFIILQEELEKARRELILVTETVDSSDLGKLITYIKGYASKLEAEKIRERTMRGKKAKLKEGALPQGTGVGIYGYDWNKETKRREISSFEAEVVRRIFNRVVSGEGLVSVARTLNQHGIATKTTKIEAKKLWHSLTIRRMIRNQAYIGKTYFGMTSRPSKSSTIIHPKETWTLLPDVTPAIVSEDIFYKANAELDKPKPRTGRPKHDYLLRGHVFCAICGRPLVGHCLSRKYRYYQCSSARPNENNEHICRARYIRAESLEDIVWSKTQEVLSNPHIILAEIQRQLVEAGNTANTKSVDAEIKEVKKRLRNYEQRRSNLLGALELDEFEKDEILDRLNNLKSLRREDELRLSDLVKIKENLSSLMNAKLRLDQLYEHVVESIQDCTPELKRLAFDALDVKTYASTDHIEVRGVIPLELPTTEQTLASLFRCRYSYIDGRGYTLSVA